MDTEPGVVHPVTLGRDSALRLLHRYPAFALDIPLHTLYMNPAVAAKIVRWPMAGGSLASAQ